jgi:hypothetical protein
MVVRKRRAITFLEIVIAVSILVVAMIPIFGLMSKETVETDKNASEAFAINKASEILNAVLDNIPFVTLRQGNPAFLRIDDIDSKTFESGKFNDAWAKGLMKMLFGHNNKETAGYPCRGIVTDSRGIHYLIHLRVEDVASDVKLPTPEKLRIGTDFPAGKPSDFKETKEFTFTYLKNPALLSDGSWIVNYAENEDEAGKPLTELDLAPGSRGIAEPNYNIYLDQGMNGADPVAPRYINPTAARYTQKMITEKVPYTADDKFAWCTMKKVVVQIQWNLEQKYFKTPEQTEGRVQRIHLMTIKGDID